MGSGAFRSKVLHFPGENEHYICCRGVILESQPFEVILIFTLACRKSILIPDILGRKTCMQCIYLSIDLHVEIRGKKCEINISAEGNRKERFCNATPVLSGNGERSRRWRLIAATY